MADKDNQTHADMSSEGDGELAAIRAILADAELVPAGEMRRTGAQAEGGGPRERGPAPT